MVGTCDLHQSSLLQHCEVCRLDTTVSIPLNSSFRLIEQQQRRSRERKRRKPCIAATLLLWPQQALSRLANNRDSLMRYRSIAGGLCGRPATTWFFSPQRRNTLANIADPSRPFPRPETTIRDEEQSNKNRPAFGMTSRRGYFPLVHPSFRHTSATMVLGPVTPSIERCICHSRGYSTRVLSCDNHDDDTISGVLLVDATETEQSLDELLRGGYSLRLFGNES
ncbi:hypothetical protein CIB48_g2028 [Xylaria polymorpha]|nr:hypothetical protein CIB48_g2028 [Xylaria polymorpha]